MSWFLDLIGHNCNDNCTRVHAKIKDDAPIKVEPVVPIQVGDWPKFTLEPFQIFHISDDDNAVGEYVSKMKSETRVVVLELTQITKEIVENAHAHGVKVIAYMSASYEEWRSDADQFPKSAMGRKMSGWDEKWGDFTKVELRDFLEARMARAKTFGCDGIEIDNMDIYADRKHGFDRPTKDQVIFAITDLASRARRLGMAYFLKTSPEISDALEPHIDGVMSEGANKYSEMDGHQKVMDNGKPVFAIEYTRKYARPTKGAVVQYKSDYFSTDYEVFYHE